MRRFSQRNSLVTLNEINITPLLDLAFVLLIIFIIVSGSIKVEQGIDLNLPAGRNVGRKLDAKDIITVSITRDGSYFLGNEKMSLETLERKLLSAHQANPNLVVAVRGDEDSSLKYTVALTDHLSENKIEQFSIRTRPTPQK